MIIARWHIDALFGHKQAVVDAIKAWTRDFGAQIGWESNQVRLTTGSIGALESTIEMEITLTDLAELNASWDKLAKLEAHKQWSKDLEAHVVSGTQRWEVLRVL
jgi:hypothetical protein